jgi:hypothetical protein
LHDSVVQRFPSWEQVTGCTSHWPVAGLQVAGLQSPSDAHVTGTEVQVLVVGSQISVVQGLPSLGQPESSLLGSQPCGSICAQVLDPPARTARQKTSKGIMTRERRLTLRALVQQRSTVRIEDFLLYPVSGNGNSSLRASARRWDHGQRFVDLPRGGSSSFVSHGDEGGRGHPSWISVGESGRPNGASQGRVSSALLRETSIRYAISLRNSRK